MLLGGANEGTSPNRPLVSTVGDKLKMAGGSRVIAVSLEDRSAILMVGHTADAALPSWVRNPTPGTQ